MENSTDIGYFSHAMQIGALKAVSWSPNPTGSTIDVQLCQSAHRGRPTACLCSKETGEVLVEVLVGPGQPLPATVLLEYKYWRLRYAQLKLLDRQAGGDFRFVR